MNGPMWIEYETCWEHRAPQGTVEWLKARKTRVTGSKVGSLVGHSLFCDPEKAGKIIAGVEEEIFNEKSLSNMAHGTKTEPIARKWYEERFNCVVSEKGLIVPKWDLSLGASVDGVVDNTEGIIEIKCPVKMYKPIIEHMNLIKQGWKPPNNYYDHIWKNHTDQMMLCLAVLGKKWCDYIVYCTSSCEVFTQRIMFDEKYWECLYKNIKTNYELYIKPHLIENGSTNLMKT